MMEWSTEYFGCNSCYYYSCQPQEAKLNKLLKKKVSLTCNKFVSKKEKEKKKRR